MSLFFQKHYFLEWTYCYSTYTIGMDCIFRCIGLYRLFFFCTLDRFADIVERNLIFCAFRLTNIPSTEWRTSWRWPDCSHSAHVIQRLTSPWWVWCAGSCGRTGQRRRSGCRWSPRWKLFREGVPRMVPVPRVSTVLEFLPKTRGCWSGIRRFELIGHW